MPSLLLLYLVAGLTGWGAGVDVLVCVGRLAWGFLRRDISSLAMYLNNSSTLVLSFALVSNNVMPKESA